MNSVDSCDHVPNMDAAMRIVTGELSTKKRWLYRALALVIFVWVMALSSMWLTEPTGLPASTNVAFAAMLVLGFGWVGVLLWILTRRSCPTAIDRIATGWMATLACSVSLVLSVAIAAIRNNSWAALTLAVTGLPILLAALLLLSSGYTLRRSLLERLKASNMAESEKV